MMARVTRGQAAVNNYVDAVRERDSLALAFEMEGVDRKQWKEHNNPRYIAWIQAKDRVVLCERKCNGGQLAQARRILAGQQPLDGYSPETWAAVERVQREAQAIVNSTAG